MRQQGPIIVPLDGSALAEGALPHAAALARALNERIVLLTVWEGAENELEANFPAMAIEIEQKANEHFSKYLDELRGRLADEVNVETRVVSGDATDQLLRAVEELDARLIVMATHGRSGLSRWVYGSTASHVLRESARPVVAVGPEALQRPGPVRIEHVMVPLDGSPLSEAALPVAESVAAAVGGRISLVRAVRWAVQTYPYSLPDAYVPQVDQELEAGAKAYLQQQRSQVGKVPVEAFVVRGGIADSLIDFAKQQQVDLIVMTTHARTGIARAALGSTADRVLHGPAPVLLIRPEQTEAS